MDKRFGLRDLLGLLRRQIRMIIASVVVVLALAGAVIFTVTPIYTATALVMVDPSDKNLLAPDPQFNTLGLDNSRVDGEVELARSDNVLLMVIDRENLVDDPEFAAELGLLTRLLSVLRLHEPTLPGADAALVQTLDKLAARVSTQRRGLTPLISISARSTDPAKAARLANAVAGAYIDSQITAKVRSTVDARDVLLQQLSSAREAVIASEGSIDRYVETHLDAVTGETGNSELSALSARLTDLTDLRQQTAAELDAAQTNLAAENYLGLAERLGDEILQNLAEQRRELLGRINDTDEATAIDLRAQLLQLESDLDAAAEAGMSRLRETISDLQDDESETREALRSAMISSGLSADALTEIYDLQQQSELARQHYEQLMARSQQLQAEAALQLADSRIVSEALRPASPSWPNTRILLLLALIGGIAIGIGAGFLYEQFLGGIISEEQLANVTHTRLALSVPRAKLRPGQTSVADTVITAPLSAFAEAMRKIRTRIDHGLAGQATDKTSRGHVVVVTSTAPGEGKTTLALALARSYALAGRKTLLIDCDLRRPALHRQLGLEPSDGLTDALQSSDPIASLQSALCEDTQTGLLSLIGSRNSHVATDQFITSRNFDRLIVAASRAFHVVILDTPPLGPVVDGIYIARKADAVMLVVQWASTSQQDIARALLSIEPALDSGALLVPVLNRQDQAATSYRHYSDYDAD